MKIKRIFLIIAAFLIVSLPAYAREYRIGELIIDEETTSDEYISYIFQILVGIGALIAVIMVFIAGIEWMTSEGNPSKIDSAKSKIKNALLGVGIILGCSLILDGIDPSIRESEIVNLACDHGIIVSTMDEGSPFIKTRCIDDTMADIKYDIIHTLDWKFEAGSILAVYAYSEINFKGERTIYRFFDNDSYGGSITGAKSIYIVKKKEGIYLFDKVGYDPDKKPGPLYTTTNISEMSLYNFDNAAKSLYIIDSDYKKEYECDYYAVAFVEPNYKGRCAFIGKNIGNLEAAGFDYSFTDLIGNETISSMITIRTPRGNNTKRGEVVLYSSVNCGRAGLIADPTEQVKECRIPITGYPSITDIMEYCEDSGFEEGEDNIMSFQINGPAGIVLSTSSIVPVHGNSTGSSDTRCEYFEEQGYCVNLIQNPNSFIYTVQGDKPKGLIIVPKNQ